MGRNGHPWPRSRDRSSGRRPSVRPSCGVANSFSATSSVSSSGVSSSLRLARCGLGSPVVVRVSHHAFQVRPVPAHPHVDRAALVVVKQPDGVHFSSIDALEVHADELLQPAGAGDRVRHPVLAAEVEVVEPVAALLVACGDLVELVFHRGGEVVVDQPAEVLLEQTDDRERHPRRDQRAALLVDVAAVLDGLDDRRVGRRAADAQLFQRLDQRRLGVARRRVGGVPVGGQLGGVDPLALGQVAAGGSRRRRPRRRPARRCSRRRPSGSPRT